MGLVSTFRHKRDGFTMIELVIVLAIIVILAALGIGAAQDLMPRYRARKAANLLASDISRARMHAIMNNRESRFEVTDYDASPTDVESPSYGAWEISVGNRAHSSTCWDVLPFDDSSACNDLYDTEGKRDISKAGQDYQRFVGLAEPDVTTITFNPRGWVANGASDLNYGDESGYIEYAIYNKMAADKGITEDHFLVRVYRSGMVRVSSGMNPEQYVNDAGGTAERSSLP